MVGLEEVRDRGQPGNVATAASIRLGGVPTLPTLRPRRAIDACEASARRHGDAAAQLRGDEVPAQPEWSRSASTSIVTNANASNRNSGRTKNGRRTRAIGAVAMADIDRLRLDAGIGIRALARGAEIDAGYLSRLFSGARTPSIGVLVALTTALGADLSIKSFPGSGPTIRDGIQARIVEALLQIAAPRWRRSVEVQVARPARGFIDVVFDDPLPPVVVATEVHSRIDRLEQQLRWAQDKARSLPSSDLWPFIDGDPEIDRLLVLRSTAATRDLARRFGATLASAYPAAARDVFAALTSDAAWPGAGILWATVTGDTVRILDRPPRGVAVGR